MPRAGICPPGPGTPHWMRQTAPNPARRSETRRHRVSRISAAADRWARNRRRLSGSRRPLRSRSGFLVDGGDIQLRESQSSRHVHRRDDGLMGGACVGANRDGPTIRPGLLEQRGPQRIGTGIDQGTLIDPVRALRRDGDHQRFVRAPRQGDFARLGKLHPDPPLLVERGRDHEEDQQHEQYVDHRYQIDFGIFAVARFQVHGQSPEISMPRSSSASTSFMASFSMRTTSRSTLLRRKRYAMSEGMATVKPAAVVMSASPMPPDNILGSPMPLAVIALNA